MLETIGSAENKKNQRHVIKSQAIYKVELFCVYLLISDYEISD